MIRSVRLFIPHLSIPHLSSFVPQDLSQGGKTRHVGKNPRHFHHPRAAQEDLLHADPAGGLSRGIAHSAAGLQPREVGEALRHQGRRRRRRERSAQPDVGLQRHQLGQATIFGLGIMPYISASIIFQLLGSVYPPLEKLQKEGETGRKKINEYTRYATVFLCLGQSWFYVVWLSGSRNWSIPSSCAMPAIWPAACSFPGCSFPF